MRENIQGKHNSYFHNNFVMARPEDQKKGLIDSAATDDVICRLNGYAIIPIEEYCKLRGEEVPEGTSEKIKEMNERLAEI